MNAFLRRVMRRMGLTGKLLLVVGCILAVSLGLLYGLTVWSAGRTVRTQLSRTERVRVLSWAVANRENLERGDRWQLAKSVDGLATSPYVVFAAIYDKAGQPVARTGDGNALGRPHTLSLVIDLRSGEIDRMASGDESASPPPLPGMITYPEEAAPGKTFKERFGSVLGDLGVRSEDLIGFVEVTLDTAPLDALSERVLGPLALLAAVLFTAGMGATLLVVRTVTAPIRMLRQQADRLAAGQTDLPLHEIPRPLDEVGDLVTHFGVMAGTIGRSRMLLEEKARRREEILAEESARIRDVAASLRASVESLQDHVHRLGEGAGSLDPDRRKCLEEIRGVTERLRRSLGDLRSAPERGDPSAQ